MNGLSNMGTNPWDAVVVPDGTLKTTMKMEVSQFDRRVEPSTSVVVDDDDAELSRAELNERWRFGLADSGDGVWWKFDFCLTW